MIEVTVEQLRASLHDSIRDSAGDDHMPPEGIASHDAAIDGIKTVDGLVTYMRDVLHYDREAAHIEIGDAIGMPNTGDDAHVDIRAFVDAYDFD